jgi:hypothetical protein
VCKDYDAAWGDWDKKKVQRARELEEIVNAARNTNKPYDALVPLSGGKDSTYVLYLARKRYRLRCLAVTYDNGFLTDHARKNIAVACDKLNVDHLFYRHNWSMMKRLYRTFFLKSGFFCPVCMRGISTVIDMAAASAGIPLILNGTCRRTEEHVAPEFFMTGHVDFFNAVIKGDPLEKQTPLGFRGDPKRRIASHLLGRTTIEKYLYGAAINLPDYIDWDYDEIFSTITRELDWSASHEEREHADCKVEDVVNYIRQRKFPALVPGLTRYSKLVTCGVLDKENAASKVGSFPQPKEPPELEYFLTALDITREQFEEVVQDKMRHMEYAKIAGKTWRKKIRSAILWFKQR